MLFRSTNGATAWANKTVLTFTPSSTADYLIIGTAIAGGDARNGAAYNGYFDMEIDGTEYGYMQAGFSDNTDRITYFSFKNLSLGAESHYSTLRYHSGSSANPDASMKNARIIAIRIPHVNVTAQGAVKDKDGSPLNVDITSYDTDGATVVNSSTGTSTFNAEVPLNGYIKYNATTSKNVSARFKVSGSTTNAIVYFDEIGRASCRERV